MKGIFRIAYRSIFGPSGKRLMALLLLRRRISSTWLKVFAALVTRRIERSFGCHIHSSAEIDSTTKFPHPQGIVIGAGVKIEGGVSIFQQVTLGGAQWGDSAAGRHPHIGSGTTIFAGAKLIGPIRIGDNCMIGANAVVLTDVPDNCTAVGIPARVVPRSIPANTPSEVGGMVAGGKP
jgi:serine O-acetyltransferase